MRDQLGTDYEGNAESAETIVDSIDLDLDGNYSIFEAAVGMTKYIRRAHWHSSLPSLIDECL